MRAAEDRLLLGCLRLAGAAAGSIVLLIVAYLLAEALPALQALGPLRWIRDASWHPAGGAGAGRFNLSPMLIGTAAAATGAVLLATPLSIASALFCRFYAPRRLGGGYRRLVQLLAGLPSVVFGFWGLVVLTPLIGRWQPPGQSLLAGILILTLMILPTISLLAESALAAVPRSYGQAAAALGLTRWATIRQVMLPAAITGLSSAILLGAARAIGETMAVLMVTGNVVRTPASLLDPVRTLTANIALELGYALELHRSALFVSGLLLMGMVALLVGISEALRPVERHG